MKKRIFTSYWFYFLGGIVMILLPALLIVVFIVVPTKDTEINKYWLLPLFILIEIFMTFMAGLLMFQFTIFTEEEIKVRCFWYTIRRLKWEEVKEVRVEKFYVSTPGAFTAKWYVFDDGIERPATVIQLKNTHITLPYSKRKQKAIETFWKGEIVEKILK